MKTLRWAVSRLAVALLLCGILVSLAYFVVIPTYVDAEYKKELSLDHFDVRSGSGVAGSQDAVYFAARYDCRNAITRISGEAPTAVYWMIGIYDNRLQRIPGGHLNNTMIDVDENGQFQVVIQRRPGNSQNTMECRNKGTGIILIRVFLPEDPEAVVAPTIQREPLR